VHLAVEEGESEDDDDDEGCYDSDELGDYDDDVLADVFAPLPSEHDVMDDMASVYGQSTHDLTGEGDGEDDDDDSNRAGRIEEFGHRAFVEIDPELGSAGGWLSSSSSSSGTSGTASTRSDARSKDKKVRNAPPTG